MHRFASPILKVAFEGPDIYEEDLYAMMRVSVLDSPPYVLPNDSPAIRKNCGYKQSNASTRRDPALCHCHIPTG